MLRWLKMCCCVKDEVILSSLLMEALRKIFAMFSGGWIACISNTKETSSVQTKQEKW